MAKDGIEGEGEGSFMEPVLNVCIDVFDYITSANAARAEEWHGDTEWSILEWAGAMCGEAGELANTAKKIRRMEQGINPESRGGNSPEARGELYLALQDEVADTFLYLNLICVEAGLPNMYVLIADKFNRVSKRDGRGQLLVAPPPMTVPPMPPGAEFLPEPQES
jgi:NTP pyrophosphatase (non-canonical NTP hydrolase)